MADSRSLSERLAKLPPGRHLVPRDFVAQNQRERMLLATAELVAERGYQKTTIELIAKTARVALSTFYEQFTSKEDCFLAAFDVAAARLRLRLEAAAGEGETWRERLRPALAELLRFVVEEPDTAMTLIVDGRAACPPALLRRDEALDRFASCLDTQVRAELPDGEAPPSAIAAAGIVGGIEALLYSRINRGETDGIESLLPSLMYFAVLPYEGQAVASEELAVPVR